MQITYIQAVIITYIQAVVITLKHRKKAAYVQTETPALERWDKTLFLYGNNSGKLLFPCRYLATK